MLRRWARNGGRWAALAVLVASPVSAGGPSAEEARSLAWLRAQITPNALVSAPDPQRRGLVLSYAPGTQPPGPLHRRAFTYDQALAAIASLVTVRRLGFEIAICPGRRPTPSGRASWPTRRA